MRGKKLIIGSLLLAATGILGACGGGASSQSKSDGEVTLSFGMGLQLLTGRSYKRSSTILIRIMTKTSRLRWM